jgi:cbb3-type cytochrome oxidase subunit 1
VLVRFTLLYAASSVVVVTETCDKAFCCGDNAVFVHGSARTCRVLKAETSVISIYDSEEYMQKTTNTSILIAVSFLATACALCVCCYLI